MEFIRNNRLEKWILGTVWEDFPVEVKTRAFMNSLDLLGALILGSKSRQFQVGEHVSIGCGLSGDIPIIGSSNTYNMLGAAISMGHASNSFDIDDGTLFYTH